MNEALPAGADAPISAPPLVPGRACGSCMLCCKLFAIADLQKPMGKWCVHASQGKGCVIHADRPGECRDFNCGWLMDATLGPEWKPDRAKFFISHMRDGNVQILVDPGAPSAWKNPVYYPTIKTFAAHIAERGKSLCVVIGKRLIVVLPEKDVDVGVIQEGHTVRIRSRNAGGRIDYDVSVEPTPAGPGA